MRKTFDSVLIAIAVIGMVAFLVATGFMTVYFRKGMVEDYGVGFADAVEYCFAFGWMVTFAAVSWLEKRREK